MRDQHRPSPRAVLAELREELCAAIAARTPLRIVGGDTKKNWWRTRAVVPLMLGGLRGVVAYAPSELVITAYAGTPLHEIQQTLAECNQMLGFEAPETGPDSTIGGVVAAGISGPSRPYRGAVRDFVLGVRLLTPDPEPLRFGGEVIKNVAGYDVSRLTAGAWGRLGPIVEISLRVIPVPEETVSLAWSCDAREAHRRMLEFGRRTMPITGLSFDGATLRLRMAGAARAIAAARDSLPPAAGAEDPGVWATWRDLTHPFLRSARAPWRISAPPAAPMPDSKSRSLWEWGGAVRWVDADLPDAQMEAIAAAAGGSARRWPPVNRPVRGALADLERRIRSVFDAAEIYNPE